MKVLVVGGTRFMGRELTWRLLAGGHQVTLLNRGSHPDGFGARVERLLGDRTADFARLVSGRAFDAAVDFAAFQGADARGVVEALRGRLGHYVLISTGQVYLVRADCPTPSREEDYDGPLMPAPPLGHPDRVDWEYGIGKRACEDVLAEAWARERFPATRLRLPMVNGERDHLRRLEGYLWRMLDGGPLLVPTGGGPRVRHVYAGDVVRSVGSLLGREAAFGRAYNLCQDETPTLAELLGLVGEVVGSAAPLVPVSAEELAAEGLDPVAVSPFSGRWMSFLEPERARRELGFRHRPLRAYLEAIVSCFLAHSPAEPPPEYSGRPQERALGARRSG